MTQCGTTLSLTGTRRVSTPVHLPPHQTVSSPSRSIFVTLKLVTVLDLSLCSILGLDFKSLCCSPAALPVFLPAAGIKQLPTWVSSRGWCSRAGTLRPVSYWGTLPGGHRYWVCGQTELNLTVALQFLALFPWENPFPLWSSVSSSVKWNNNDLHNEVILSINMIGIQNA